MNQEKRLESWKEIEAYLKRDFRTLRRWEKEEGLPVHRHTHKSRSSVYAYPSEIDTWRASRKVVAEPAPARPLWKIPVFAVTLFLCLVMVGNGVRPVSAQQSGTGKAARQVWVTQPSEDPTYGSVSVDGRYIAFTDWETGDLGVRDLKAGTSRRITNTGGFEVSGDYAQNSIFSPDGRHIAYNWFIQKDLHEEVRVIPTVGGAPRTIWRSEGFDDYVLPKDWTPNGKQLVVTHILPDRTSQLALLTVQDGSLRSLKSFPWQNFNASLSPDGRLIAYDSPASENTPARDIFVLATDGSREMAVVQNPASDSEPIWSPDGSQIFFLSDRTGQFSLWSVPFVDGKPGEAKLVKADLSRADNIWMTHSGTLYYQIPGTASPNIYSAELGADMKVSKPPVLAVERFVNSNNGPGLSPDGQRLAYESFRPGSGTALAIQTINTGEERIVPAKVPVGMIYGIGPLWFPDARSVLVISRVPPGPGLNFYRIDVASGDAERLLRTDHNVLGYKLAPDGKSLFFTEGIADSEKTRLVRFDIEARRETELKTSEQFMSLAVSPDGKQLAYLVQTPGPASYLAVMPAEGGPSREVFRGSPWLDGSRFNTLAWTPNQRYLLFVRGSAGDNAPNVLWRVPVSGGPAEQMGLSMAARIKSPQIHPDGKRILFSAGANGPSEIWALENFLPGQK